MSQDALFDDLPDDLAQAPPFDGDSRSPGADLPRSARVENSALWAGWADALGFISEITTEAGLRRRLKGRSLTQPVEWRRRVGGRSGPDVVLPAGTYSDDTQLRLATGRCIQHKRFDVEAFAHVELPVWLAYALGGGKGTKAAASRMMGANSSWYAGQGEGWTQTGGNGAAMRIQPHVWATGVVADRGRWLSGLLADACTTHAHPRALLGAVFHAYALSLAVSIGELPKPDTWADLLAAGAIAGRDELFDHPEIGDYWIGAYDASARSLGAETFESLWFATAKEMQEQVVAAAAVAHDSASGDLGEVAQAYRRLVVELNLVSAQSRGSGSATVIAALWLAHVFSHHPAAGARIAAADISTDTDTIATMAAGLAGATCGSPPPPIEGSPDFSDHEYIRSEARRLAAMAVGAAHSSSIRYPDLLRWTLPKAQVDLVGRRGNDIVLAGLSRLNDAGLKPINRGNFVWGWYRTDWGQHVLVKHRSDLPDLADSLLPAPQEAHDRGGSGTRPKDSGRPEEPRGTGSATTRADQPNVSLESVLRYLESQQFSDAAVAYTVRRMASSVSERDYVSFSRALYKAMRTRR